MALCENCGKSTTGRLCRDCSEAADAAKGKKKTARGKGKHEKEKEEPKK